MFCETESTTYILYLGYGVFAEPMLYLLFVD
jgi:hypothetical protein